MRSIQGQLGALVLLKFARVVLHIKFESTVYVLVCLCAGFGGAFPAYERDMSMFRCCCIGCECAAQSHSFIQLYDMCDRAKLA